MSELKTCPFCGGEARLYTTKSVQSYRRAVVKCETCFAELRKEGGGYHDFPGIPQVDDKRKTSNERAKELAIEAWNTRVADAENGKLRKLAADLYEAMCDVSETWAEDVCADRMHELGIEVDND